MKWGSTSSPHIGDMMTSLFFTLGSSVHDWGWPKNGPFWTKNGQTWQAWQHSKVIQKGPKGTKIVNISVFDHLGPVLGPSGRFWSISDKHDSFASNGKSRVWQKCFWGKISILAWIGLKGSRWAQKESQMVKNTYVDQFGPFRTLLDHFGVLTSLPCLALFGPEWVQKKFSTHI